MLDLSELAVNDVKWLNIAISHIKKEFYKLKSNTQEQYKIHNCHFEEMVDFLDMYEYLADDRLAEQKRLAEKYEKEAAAQGVIYEYSTHLGHHLIPFDFDGHELIEKAPQADLVTLLEESTAASTSQ